MGDMENPHGSDGAANAWRLRPVLLAVIGALAMLSVQQLVDFDKTSYQNPPLAPWRLALATGIGTGVLAFGFALERQRWIWSAVFAAIVGLVTGLIYYWSGNPGGGGWLFGDWRYASLFLAIAIVVPLFQTARDAGAWRFPYAEVHGNAWTNVVLWFACWMFSGIVFALAWLLASLFDLIGLSFLHDLLDKYWFSVMLFGAAFGGSLGLFRERDRVVRLLQRVVTAVLAVLAPVLGVGLLVFLVALPFTGLGALWEATKSTTPILLGCVIGALILANAVIGNGEEEELGNPALRWGAMALALSALPLCFIAAIATGLRVEQYGFTPDRLWALVFVILATAYGVAYLVSLVLGRMAWAEHVRPANLRLAFVVAGVALFLATPILSFNAISTRDQVARLESGEITPGKFDWVALAFDFGDPGKAALKRLQGSKNASIAAKAEDIASKTNRWDVVQTDTKKKAAERLVDRLRVLPATVPVPQELREKLTEWNGCGDGSAGKCTLMYTPGATEAFAIRNSCADAKTNGSGSSSTMVMVQGATCTPEHLWLKDGEWAESGSTDLNAAQQAAVKAGMQSGKIEVRTVPRRQLFVGGVPVGDPFE